MSGMALATGDCRQKDYRTPAASLYCAPRPWLGVNFFCFSQSAAAGLFNGRKVCSLPFFYPKWSIWGISAQTFRHGTGLTDSGAFVA